MATSFWDMFFDNEYRRRSDINANRDMELVLGDQLASVQATAATSAARLRELTTGFGVLVDMLVEQGAIDPQVLKARMFEILHPAPPPAVAHVERTVRCGMCSHTVPERQTVITERGTYCDSCAAQLNR